MSHVIARSPAPHRGPAHSRGKAWLLGSASALVLGAVVPAPAFAVVYPGYPATYVDEADGQVATGYTVILTTPINTGPLSLSATIQNGVAGTVIGPGSGAIVTANSFAASTGGNDVVNSITGTTLPLPNSADPSPDGIAVLGDSQNTDVTATSKVANSYFASELFANSAGDASITDNIMSATTTLNQSTTVIDGQVPLLYTSPFAAQSATNNEVDSVYYPYFAVASVIATNAQENYDSGELAGSGAMVTESYAGELIRGAPNTNDALYGSPSVTDNTMAATFTGNAATTSVTIGAGGAPTFTGSVALTNAQFNGYDSGTYANPSAIVKYSYVGIGVLPGGGEDGSTIALRGSAAVTGNTIAATAIGNNASGTSLSGPTGNVLTLSGGIGLSGASSQYGAESYVFEGAPSTNVIADALVNNVQDNFGAPLNADVKQNGVLGVFYGVYGGTAAVSGNTIAAEAIGNQAYNAILAPGLGTPGTGSPLAGQFALNSVQNNAFSAVTATQLENVTGILTGPTLDGTLTVDGNALTSSATGNTVANQIALNSSDLISTSGNPAGVFINFRSPEIGVSDFGVYADVMLNSLQVNDYTSPVTAINTLPVVGILAGLTSSVAGSTLSVTNTISAALAEGNSAGNSLALTASTINTSAALSNAQSSYATVTALLSNPITGLVADPSGSTLSLTGNLERAIATGNAASSALIVTGSSIAVSNEGGPASSIYYIPGATYPFNEFEGPPGIRAGFVAYNDQATTAAVSAEVEYSVPSLLVGTVGGLLNSSVANSTNAIVAAARGSEATTQLTLAPTNSLSIYQGNGEDGYSPFASLTSIQTLADGTPVTAVITANASVPPIYTAIAGGMAGSTVTSAGNQIQALAQGNNAANTLTLSGTGTVVQPGGSIPAGLVVPALIPLGEDAVFTSVIADAAFALNNLQYAGTGTVGAHQSGSGDEVNVLGNTGGSTVVIGGDTAPLANVIASTATANLAANTLTLNATNLSASAGLLNFQVSEGTTVATLTGPTGFEIALDGYVNNSTLAIEGNQIGTAATANAATNIVSSTASLSSSSLSFAEPTLVPFYTGPGAFTDSYFGTVVTADLALLNDQALVGGEVGALSNGAFLITNAAVPSGANNSALSISNNVEQAIAAGNEATNSLTLSPGITPANATSQTASLLSEQFVSTPGGIGASSTMLLSAPITMLNSSLTISGNTNTASAIANEAVNTVTITGSTILPGYSTNEIGYAQAFNAAPGIYGYADYSLFNVQSVSGGSVQSTATTTAVNSGLYGSATGIAGSSVTFDSNTTLALALANSASNTLSLSAAGASGAQGTVGSNQLNSDAVSATATIDVVFGLGQFSGGNQPTSSHSTYSVTNNTTQALATGNQVTNALNASPTAYGTPANIPGSNVDTGTNPQTSATYTVLNTQNNSGAVTATAYGQSPPLQLGGIITTGPDQGGYGVALRTTGFGNTANVSGNSVNAQAIGNRASNTLTLVALNTGSASAAINSVQVNSAPITASVNNVTFGVASAIGTTAHVANNQLAASAFGNVVTNSIVTH